MFKIYFLMGLLLLSGCANDTNSNDQQKNPSVSANDFSKIVFQGLDYDQTKIEVIKMAMGAASISRNTKDGKLKIGLGIQEFSLNANPCSQENNYAIDPSEMNPKQRIFSIFNLDVNVGVKQMLTNKDYYSDQTSPAGRVFFFYESPGSPKISALYPSATGEVTILELTDSSVTLFIDHFAAIKNPTFTIHGTITLPVCNR